MEGSQALGGEAEAHIPFYSFPQRRREPLSTTLWMGDTVRRSGSFAPWCRRGCLFPLGSKLLYPWQLLNVWSGWGPPRSPLSIIFRTFLDSLENAYFILTLRSTCQVLKKNYVDILNQINYLKFVDYFRKHLWTFEFCSIRYGFGWQTYNSTYGWCIIESYTRKLYNFINQWHPQ